MKFDWKQIYRCDNHFEGDFIERAKVIGGWLVKHTRYWFKNNMYNEVQSMNFIADEFHRWEIDKQ